MDSDHKLLTIGRGEQAEQEALRFLQNNGLVLVERNYRCRTGEIDLVMNDGEMIVFVEVRYRKSARYGSAAESVDRHKQSRLITCANHYLTTKNLNASARFDVIAMAPDKNKIAIQWIQDAFQA